MDTHDQILLRWHNLQNSQDASHFLAYAIILVTVLAVLAIRNKGPKLPELNPRTALELSNTRRTRQFMRNSIDLLTKGRSLFPDSPYKLFCDWGELTVLPPESVDDIRSDRRFDFAISASDVCLAYFDLN